MSHKTGTLRTLTQNALLALVTAAVALGAAELALRTLAPRSDRHYVLAPNQTSIVLPDSRFIPGVSGEATYMTSSLGIRGAELGPDGTEYRILAIGGSTTQNIYHDQSESWTILLGQLLGRTATGLTTWSGDVGRSGHTARSHVLQLEVLVEELPPIDAVVMLVGVNDMTRGLRRGLDYEPPAPLSEPDARRAQLVEAFAELPGRFHERRTNYQSTDTHPIKRTALWQLGSQVRASRRLQRQNLVQDPNGEIYDVWRRHRQSAGNLLDTLPDLTPRLEIYRRYLEAMADTAERSGVRVVLMTQPSLWRADLTAAEESALWLGGIGEFQTEPGHDYFSSARLAEAMAAYNQALLDVCSERGLECIDLASMIPKDLDHFYDDVHFTELGARRVAEHVAAHFAALAPYVAN